MTAPVPGRLTGVLRWHPRRRARSRRRLVRLGLLRSGGPSRRAATPSDDLALLLDLLAAALAAGAPLVPALDAVGAAVGEPVPAEFDRVRDLVVAGQLDRVADGLRAGAAAAALDRAHRVGIWAVLPLGLCCLPAFVALAVVPLAYGLLRGTLG
jgi:hypothetical protein